MNTRHAITLGIVTAALVACSSDERISAPPPAPPAVQLKDVVIPNLPSPYYHFDYNAEGRISGASFASGLRTYDVDYASDRLVELSGTLGTTDHLDYVYDESGRVSTVKYVNSDGVIFTTVFFTYSGQQLTKLERDRRVTGGFIIDKTMSFSYYDDGNLRQITEHHPAIDGEQTEATFIDLFEQYDDKINVDGFSLIHNEFFDHLILLPGVELQKGNPARVTRTGDGENYIVDYTYYYDGNDRPREKIGSLLFTSGPNAGTRFGTLSQFSYY